jgi:hypothetical protein
VAPSAESSLDFETHCILDRNAPTIYLPESPQAGKGSGEVGGREVAMQVCHGGALHRHKDALVQTLIEG